MLSSVCQADFRDLFVSATNTTFNKIKIWIVINYCLTKLYSGSFVTLCSISRHVI